MPAGAVLAACQRLCAKSLDGTHWGRGGYGCQRLSMAQIGERWDACLNWLIMRKQAPSRGGAWSKRGGVRH